MTDLGLMYYFLVLEVVQSIAGIFMSQKKYVLEIFTSFQMEDYDAVCTPSSADLNLKRPDIMHVVSLISRYMENPRVTPPSS